MVVYPMAFLSFTGLVYIYDKKMKEMEDEKKVLISMLSETGIFLLLAVLFHMMSDYNRYLPCYLVLLAVPVCWYFQKKKGLVFHPFLESALCFYVAVMSGIEGTFLLLFIMGISFLIARNKRNRKREYIHILLLGIEAISYCILKEIAFPKTLWTTVFWVFYMETGGKILHRVILRKLLSYVRKTSTNCA